MAENLNQGPQPERKLGFQQPKDETSMTVGAQFPAPLAKPVDRRTLAGSTPGDFSAEAAPAVLPANPGPRDGMGQSRVTSSRLDQPAQHVTDTDALTGIGG